MAQGKKYTERAEALRPRSTAPPAEAFELVKTLGSGQVRRDRSTSSIRLGVDPRKADQMVRGTVALPGGTGKDVRVAVFAQGDAANAGS